MADEIGKAGAERATENAMADVADLVNTPGAVFATAEVSGVALGDDLELLTLNQGLDVLIEWKSSLHVYGSDEPLIRATAYFTGDSPDDERRFWREMGAAVKKAELLKADLEKFLTVAHRFPKPRPF